MRVHSEWSQFGAEVKADFVKEIDVYERAKRAPRSAPLDAIFERLRTMSRTWMSLITSSNGRDAMAAREMRPALDATIVHVARLCMRDDSNLDRIGDADARRAVEATMKKIRERELET